MTTQIVRHAVHRVLVVDDSRDLAESLVILLGIQGYNVRTANDGAGALAIAAEFHPEVVLLDIGLPDVDGIQVAGEMRWRYGSKMRIVAHTAFSNDATGQSWLESGFDDVLLKPSSAARILSAVTGVATSL